MSQISQTLLLALLISFFTGTVWAAEGFQRSSERNVVMVRGGGQMATGFLLRVRPHGMVIITKKSLFEAMREEVTLQWGNSLAWLRRLRVVEDAAYQTQLRSQVIGRDEASDLIALRLPQEVFHLCRCDGFEAAPAKVGPAKLFGYPVLEKRVAENALQRFWLELWGDVRQQVSEGKIWAEGGNLAGDMDALPGNEGGPVLDGAGRVMGVVGAVSANSEINFRYSPPTVHIVALEPFLASLATR